MSNNDKFEEHLSCLENATTFTSIYCITQLIKQDINLASTRATGSEISEMCRRFNEVFDKKKDILYETCN